MARESATAINKTRKEAIKEAVKRLEETDKYFGGDFEKCAYLAKKALCRDVKVRNPKPLYAGLEQKMLDRINALGIGPQGFGGTVTCLAVNIEEAPTHIAGLPVSVNVGCHVTRHAEKVI